MQRWIIILFLFATGRTSAQQLYFFQPDNLRQLPSSETYNIFQDSRGYIWFSTEGGLCQYNGNTIRIFAAKEGLPESATYSLWEDKEGFVWVTTSQNRILYYNYKTDILTEASFSKKCQGLLKAHLQQIYFSRLIGNELWLCSQRKTLQIDLKKGAVAEIKENYKISELLEWRSNKLIPIKVFSTIAPENSDLLYRKGDTMFLVIKKGVTFKTIPFHYPKKSHLDHRLHTAFNSKGEQFISVENYLFKINPDLTFKVTDVGHFILGLYIDKDDGIWIGTLKAGVRYFPDPNDLNKSILSLNELSVSGICEDHEKGIWCSTLERGIFYTRNKFVICYTNVPGLDKSPELLKERDGNLFISSNCKELFCLQKKIIKKYSIINPLSIRLNDILPNKYGWTLCDQGYVAQANKDFKLQKDAWYINKNLRLGAVQLGKGPAHKTFALHSGGLMNIEDGEEKVLIHAFKARAKCMLSSNHFGFLIGGRDGLYRVDTNNYEMTKIKGIEGSVSGMIDNREGDVLVCTKDKGIYLLKNNTVVLLDTLLGLPNYRFSDITLDDRHGIWLASNAGLLNLREPFVRNKWKIYTSRHGLPSNDIHHVAVHENNVYVSTNEGLFSLPAFIDLRNTSQPQIHLRALFSNGKSLNPGTDTSIDYNNNNIRIVYDLLTFKKTSSLPHLFYTLEGLDNIVHFSTDNELLFTNLHPGNYTLTAFALTDDNMPGKTPSVFRFEIKKPVWQNTFFIIAVLLLQTGLVYLIINLIIKRIRKKEEEKTRVNKLLAEYQMSAMRAQMNPHFIFNCINSIQRYIITNKAEEAYTYLSKFSKLIRMVLNYAEESLISLAEEIAIVELYVEMEQMRFEKKFTFKVNIPDTIDPNELIVPAMIMQPYIENSIWHGLMNLEEEKTGHIEVIIQLNERILQIVIEDNGVGLEKAKALTRKNHRSKGTNINSRRAEILNIMSNTDKGKIMIEEMKTNGKVVGTKVIINIPQNQENDE